MQTIFKDLFLSATSTTHHAAYKWINLARHLNKLSKYQFNADHPEATEQSAYRSIYDFTGIHSINQELKALATRIQWHIRTFSSSSMVPESPDYEQAIRTTRINIATRQSH